MRTIIAVLALLGLAGCTTGTDFARPTLDAFTLGTTTRADIVAAYGEPPEESAITITPSQIKPAATESRLNGAPVAGSFRRMIYSFEDRSETIWVSATAIHNKFLICVLWNDALVSYDYSSDFAKDSTDFDSVATKTLAIGQTTKQQLIDVLGPPTGRAVYPAILRQDDEKWYYFFLGIKDGKTYKKLLEVLFGPDDVVADFRMAEDSAPTPVPQAPSAPMPIFIPTK